MLFVAFECNQFRGEIWPELERLKGDGFIRILDLLFVRKDGSGAVAQLQATDLGWEEAVEFGEAMGALAGFARSGMAGLEAGAMLGMADLMDGHLFDKDDAFRLEQLLPNDTSAAVVLFEHVWAKPLLDAIARAYGIELLNEWIRPEAVLAAGGSFRLDHGTEGVEPTDADLE